MLIPGFQGKQNIFTIFYRNYTMTEINTNSMTEKTLSVRWEKTPETIRHLRKTGHAPRHFKVGATVRYLLSEVEKFEAGLEG